MEKRKHQAHGLTVEEMKELHYKQVHEPDTIEMVEPNNGGDKITDPYFAKDYGDYMLPIHERHVYHVAAEARAFRSSGAIAERTSVSTVHKLTKEAYEFQKKNKAFEGQIVHILHNPELEQVSKPTAPKAPKAPAKNEGEDLTLLTVVDLKARIEKLSEKPVPKSLKKKEDLLAELKKLMA